MHYDQARSKLIWRNPVIELIVALQCWDVHLDPSPHISTLKGHDSPNYQHRQINIVRGSSNFHTIYLLLHCYLHSDSSWRLMASILDGHYRKMRKTCSLPPLVAQMAILYQKNQQSRHNHATITPQSRPQSRPKKKGNASRLEIVIAWLYIFK